MASYFVARQAQPGGGHAVHDRSRCPPATFPTGASEYLGEFDDSTQAIVVARVRYAHAGRCACLGGEASTPSYVSSSRPAPILGAACSSTPSTSSLPPSS